MPPPPDVPPAAPPDPIAAILELWPGRFDNARQVAATLARGGPAAPELPRERRWLEVVRLEAPQLGAAVLYLQEFRASLPTLAQRQRVLALVWEEERQAVRAQQLFFASGPTYDRPPLAAEQVAGLPPEAFVRHPGCDLFFRWEGEHRRWRAAMLPGACRYCHPGDGEVAAEYEMLLQEGQLWYRDRSLRVADGSVRGEIAGFSWLLFDRRPPGPPPPDLHAPADLPMALIAQQGVWQGTFRRYDGNGSCCDSFASTIVVRLEERSGQVRYHQSNHYRWPDGAEQAFDSEGEICDGRIWFHNGQLEGWAMELPEPGAAGDGSSAAVLRMWSQKQEGAQQVELIQLSSDGRRRHRLFQSVCAGEVVRRTVIDEEKVSDDWRAWDAAAAVRAATHADG
ncbi:MAG: CpcT/CpeT family chromophore lyase [Cyanobium sp.]